MYRAEQGRFTCIGNLRHMILFGNRVSAAVVSYTAVRSSGIAVGPVPTGLGFSSQGMTRDGGRSHTAAGEGRGQEGPCPGASAGPEPSPWFHGFWPERREKKRLLSLSPYSSVTEAAGSQHRGQPGPRLCGPPGLPGGYLPAHPIFLTPWPCGRREVTCPASIPPSVK